MLDYRIKVKVLTEGCQLEQHGDWIDLKAAETIEYKKGDAFLVPLGVAMDLPRGYEAHMLPRSSTFKKYHVIMANSMGIIDNAYCGNEDEWKFSAYATEDGVIHKGDRIAQFRITPIMMKPYIEYVDMLIGKNRGGFGSSGV